MLWRDGFLLVIQPFDKGGRFDKRYEDTFAPAIQKAGLEPYRVDRDPQVAIPIDEIHSRIKEATACLADISTDNPNVWYELGFAIAAGKPLVMVCETGRSKFPFDIQHRSIITYDVQSRRDWDRLSDEITTRLEGAISKDVEIASVAAASRLKNVEGLSQHEMVALVAIAENTDYPGDAASAWQVRQDMEKAGFEKIAFRLGTEALLQKQFIAVEQRDDRDGPYTAFSVTPRGMDWRHRNQNKLRLQKPDDPNVPISDDDIPF